MCFFLLYLCSVFKRLSLIVCDLFQTSRPELIDNKTVDGHVIPKQVLFTAATKRDYPFQSAADGDNLKVVITFSEENYGKSKTSEYHHKDLVVAKTFLYFFEVRTSSVPWWWGR